MLFLTRFTAKYYIEGRLALLVLVKYVGYCPNQDIDIVFWQDRSTNSESYAFLMKYCSLPFSFLINLEGLFGDTAVSLT